MPPIILGINVFEVYQAPKQDIKFSVVVPFTRWWLVDDFLKMFDRIDFFREATECIFLNDTDNRELNHKLKQYLDNSDFGRVQLAMSQLPEPDPINLHARRKRIVGMRQYSKNLIGNTKFVFSIEDDTFVPPNAFMRLYDTINREKNVAFVSGVEAGRHAFKIVGAWQTDNVYNPSYMQTAPYRPTGLQEIDGGGMYCYITPTEFYKDAIYRFEGECFGPDVMYVLDLRRKGFRALVDWDLRCLHKHNNSMIAVDEDCVSIKWAKDGDKWLLQDDIVGSRAT